MFEKVRPLNRCKLTASTVAVSLDGTRYLWGGGSPGEDCPVVVCDAATDKVLFVLKRHKKPVVRARFLKDGSIVSFSFDSHLCGWSPQGELIATNNVRLTNRADGFSVTSDGKIAVCGDYQGGISAWDADGKGLFNCQTGPRVWAVALDPKGKQYLTGNAEGDIQIWKVAKQKPESTIAMGVGHHIQGLTWHPTGKSWAAAIAPDGLAEKGAQSRILIFDAKRSSPVQTFFSDGHQPLCCTFSPDGSLLAAAGGGTDRGVSESKKNCVIHVWEVASGKEVAALGGHSSLVRDLAFSPDSQWLLSAGWDDTVRCWRLA